jgi:hypothetical protein
VSRRRRTVLAIGVLATLGSACASLLGVDDVGYVGATDAGTLVDGTTDGPSPDAPSDAPSDVAVTDAALDGGLRFDATTIVLQHLGAPPTELATDGFSLFWAVGSQVFRSDGGPDAATLLTDAASPVAHLVATGSYLAWTTSSALQATPTAGGSLVDVVSARTFGATGGTAYFKAGGTGSQINGCSLSAACPAVGALLGYGYPNISEIVAGETTVYFFASSPEGGTAVYGCEISLGCLDGSAPSVPGLQSPSGLAFDGTSLFWVEGNAVMTTQRTVAANKPKFVAAGENKPHAVASDGVYAYWTSDDGVRAKVVATGAAGTVGTLAAARGGPPSEIVVFGDWVVWLSPATLDILAAPRPR